MNVCKASPAKNNMGGGGGARGTQKLVIACVPIELVN